MLLKNETREPLEDLLCLCKYVEEDSMQALFRELRFFRNLEERGFFCIPETKEIAAYYEVLRKMAKENERQLQNVKNLLMVINDNMTSDESAKNVEELMNQVTNLTSKITMPK